MSKKINLLTNKLGILQVWNHNYQRYGSTFKTFKQFIYSKIYIYIYLKRLLFLNGLLIKNIFINESFHKAEVKVLVFSLLKNKNTLKKQKLRSLISYWLKLPVLLSFYKENSIKNSSLLVVNHMNFLFNKKFITPKRLLRIIYNNLKNQLEVKKVIYSNKGIKHVYLKGFKLELSGCFESSKSQMAKVIKCNFGSTPLTKLKGYIDYSKSTFFTKFGSCGIKVWLFYEF